MRNTMRHKPTAKEIKAARERATALPIEEATPDEIAAMERGREEAARGEYVTLDELLDDMGTEHNKKRSKSARQTTR